MCPCLLAMKHFYSFVSQVRHCWCHVAFLFICFSGLSLVVSALHEAFLFICLPGVSLLVSALFRRQSSISIHLSTITAVSALFCGHALVSQVCHCWCPPFSAGDATFLFIGAAALFRWPCSISIHLSPMRLLSFCLSGFGACTAVFCRVTVSGSAFLPHCVTLSALFSFSGKRWMNDRIGFRRRGSDLSVQLGRRACVRHQKSISCHILRSSCFYFLSSRGQLLAD